MSQLEQFQSFVRKNGKQLTGVDVPVVLSDENCKSPQLKFNFGWRIEIGVGSHSHGAGRPQGINCGSRTQAKDAAHNAAQEYVSGRDPLFNARFKKMLSHDVGSNFLLSSQNLGSTDDRYVGSDPCGSCGGSGCNTCNSCSGRGRTNCSSCYGTGRKEVSRYDSYTQRTVYTTESCFSCAGSGYNTCSYCGGSGSVTCSTCRGSGYLYYSYTIDGDAKRETKWYFNSDDYHSWTRDYICNSTTSIIHGMENITEIDVEGDLEGCTFIYGFTANLPTRQYTASINNIDTHMCFAGKQNLTHDAGGVYDPAVWSVAKNLGAGDKEDDTKALATPAIKEIIESQTVNKSSALLEENWVSKDIKNAVMANYDTLVMQLKKQSVKGIIPKMLTGLLKYGYLFFMISLLIALTYPEFAQFTDQRIGLVELPQWYWAILTLKINWFGDLPIWANYPILIGIFILSYQGVKLFSWRPVPKWLCYMIALLLTYFLPHIILSLYYNTLEIIAKPQPALGHAFVGGSIFLGCYLLALGWSIPKKWYLKPLGVIAAGVIHFFLQFGMMKLDKAIGLLPQSKNYVVSASTILKPAYTFVSGNLIEIVLLTIVCTYVFTRRRFWLNSKSAVADYNSPVLMKSMKMD